MLENHRAGLRCITITFALLITAGQTILAQSRVEEKKKLTLEEAVDFALKNYPAVRAALERVRAAQAGVGLARTNYLPRADMVWQTNRATDNNITGLLLPQSIIAPISGPVPYRHRIEALGEVRQDSCSPGNPSILDTGEQKWTPRAPLEIKPLRKLL